MREVDFTFLKVKARILKVQQRFFGRLKSALSLEGGGNVYSEGPR